MRQAILSLLFLILSTLTSYTFAQNIFIEGYVLQSDSENPLNAVDVQIFQKSSNQLLANAMSNEAGYFKVDVPIRKGYLIEAKKNNFHLYQMELDLPPTYKNEKLLLNVNMIRKDEALSKNTIVSVTDQLVRGSTPDSTSTSSSTNKVKVYGIDADKINPAVHPDGVELVNLARLRDSITAVTIGTRLANEQYIEATDRELRKRLPMPTNYQPTAKVDPSKPQTSPNINQGLPNAYEQTAANKNRIQAIPLFGETLVASAQNNSKAHGLPAYYTGYKIEFLNSLSPLPPNHEIFNRHGNIRMEQQANGLYSYLLGDFEDEKTATAFLNDFMQNKYPAASLVHYENGKRKKVTKTKKTKLRPAYAPPR